VFEQIRRETKAGRNAPGGERETGGVLFGIQELDRVRILAHKPLQCEHAMGPGFILSETDQQRLAQLILLPAADAELHGLQALGWYHSHLHSRIFLSPRDQEIHSRYFAAPYQIALVIHPLSDGAARAGFFFRELSGEMRWESSYEEFTIEIPAPAVPEPKPAAISKRAPSHSRTASPVKPKQEREAICPRCGSKHVARSRRTGPFERLREVFGFYPYRCHECLSRSFLKTSSDVLERARSRSKRRPEERRRTQRKTRREILLWGGGILGFLATLYYVVQDTGGRPDAP
jgi:proteasome lid subunit RPN8/RPN11/DNA-directed RNA polymerase subunit RPC12/RpoP